MLLLTDKDSIIQLLIDNPHLIDTDNIEIVKLEYPEFFDTLTILFDALNPIMSMFKDMIDSIFGIFK